MLDFYTAGTPNGYKVAIMLEECGIAYTPRYLDLGALEQKQDWFTAINPNGRVPAIVDHDAAHFAVFESGAILIYLADKTGLFCPTDSLGRTTVLQWLMWQMAGLGPMTGQLNVFRHYFPEKLEPVINRYERECYRLYGVLERQLVKQRFVAGSEYSIADIACWPWILSYGWAGLSLDNFPALQQWFEEVKARPAVTAALKCPPLKDPAADYRRQVESTRPTLA
ncbi:MAG TPA: glutathione binding-like protein [Steroidobacteraceae bacterium]|nr:glutathione binding-like protein [Steroidobacteraceae bacterium]